MDQLHPKFTSLSLKPLANLPPVVFPPPIVGFGSVFSDLEAALQKNLSFEAVERVLQVLAQSLPFHPLPEIVYGGIWVLKLPRYELIATYTARLTMYVGT